ncbi:MAG: short chain dehydrogenase [Legionellales bacterium]|nr:short chain dehydrogenase [Legionellales bacterium]|tara:strand:+ start:481 stop:1296 length:816 start_codon:yes stop_codon:yes gene_type:complete
MSFKDKVVFITGSTRGIGREIALKLAKDGAIIVVTGKTEKPHAKLPGTIHTVAQEINELGGIAEPFILDVRDEMRVREVVDTVGQKYGKIDALINNASAISLTNTENTPMRKFDLMFGVNVRATFACSQACIPYLEKADNPHILTLSPPLNMQDKWFKDHVAYTMAKYGMSMCTLGMAAELKPKGIAVNSLWPQTTIATMAVKVHFPEALWQASRKPEIMADATYQILMQDSQASTGQFFIDEAVLKAEGVTDFSKYAINPEVAPFKDLFL